MKVAVLTGGIGEERNISLQSGDSVANSLRQAAFDVVTADITPDRLDILDDDTIDVFFLALHGRFGEDGQLQQILEDRSLVYTGSGPMACKLALDKMESRKIFAQVGITTPEAIDFGINTDIERLEKQLQQLGNKYVVKPITQGSSVGVSIVDNWHETLAAAQKCQSKFGDCMIQKFVPGRDVTVGILGDQVLPIIELRTQNGIYDYQAKYNDEQTEFLFETIDDHELTARINQAALDCFNALGCQHFARVDFRLSDDGVAYALELNAIPGFTTRSDFPKAAAKAGLSMSSLSTKIVQAAITKKTY